MFSVYSTQYTKHMDLNQNKNKKPMNKNDLAIFFRAKTKHEDNQSVFRLGLLICTKQDNIHR